MEDITLQFQILNIISEGKLHTDTPKAIAAIRELLTGEVHPSVKATAEQVLEEVISSHDM